MQAVPAVDGMVAGLLFPKGCITGGGCGGRGLGGVAPRTPGRQVTQTTGQIGLSIVRGRGRHVVIDLARTAGPTGGLLQLLLLLLLLQTLGVPDGRCLGRVARSEEAGQAAPEEAQELGQRDLLHMV